MGIFKMLKNKKEESEEESLHKEEFPDELEQFRLPPPKIDEKPSPFESRPAHETGKPFVPPDIMERAVPKTEEKAEKLDLILSKLETIDTRLKLIEEKLQHRHD